MVKNEISSDEVVMRMGIFRAFYASAVQFNSVLFRVIVGVFALLSGVPADTVALVTLIEFLLNGLLEVPFGYFADRFGRVPLIILSLILIMSGLTCVYLALIINNEFSRILFICHAVLIGIAKPLNSGSVEAFYQSALEKSCKTEEEKKITLTSLTASQNHGKYYTTIAVIFSFFLTWVFNLIEMVPHAFIFGILLYAVCILTLWRDYVQFGDIEKTLLHSTPMQIIRDMTSNKQAKVSIVYNLSFWMITVAIAGYLVVSLGREETGFQRWAVMIFFMLGYSAFGWILKGYVLPVIIRRLKKRNYLLLSFGLIFILSVCFLFIYQNSNFLFQIFYIFIYGIIFHTATSAIQNLSMNQLMHETKKQDYALALSFQNIFGYLWVGFYSLYLTIVRNGAPSVREAFLTTIIISLFFILFVFFVESSSSKSEQS